MKILLLADIHANWEALSVLVAQESGWDACLFVGDVVDYGVQPEPCVEWVRQNATACVRGNHDHAVAQRITAKGGSGYRALAAATRPIQWEQLSDAQLGFLARMPVTQYITLGDWTFYLVHGTPHDPLDEYLAEKPQTWQKRLENVQADFVCVGHTHLPFKLELDSTCVINPGSVGQPRDGDPRGSYAVFEDGRIEFRRFEYNIDACLAQLRNAGVTGEAYTVAESSLRSGGQMCRQNFPVEPIEKTSPSMDRTL